MMAFLKKPGEKRPREDESAPPPCAAKPVSTLCAWNANSFLVRIKNDPKSVAAFLTLHAPDAIVVTEVRMPAAVVGGGAGKKGDGKPRSRSTFSTATKALADEAQLVKSFVLEHGYRAHYSLADTKYAGTALLVRRECEQPASLRYSLDPAAPAERHHPDGRVVACSFGGFELLGTYAPNNGTDEVSFERRRVWDAEVRHFVQQPRTKPLVWMGDLNVAAAWHDVGPEPKWFREQPDHQARP